ncbi:MAG: Gfo/Idh/MocA family oxidoreductase [Lachnospiraceae bacterium]|nr:Gfo/Idh/MocA family oxidoreductase [Lachnospiraceae bacterium]
MNVVILGTGYMAGLMAETIRGTGAARICAVGSRNYERAREFAKEYGFKKYYGSYEEAADDPEADMVYIATPHTVHYENVKMALEKGKNVLCEKPFALNAAQAEELFALAREKKLFCQEAMWIRFLPFYEQILNVLRKGTIGEPVMLTANLGYNVGRMSRMVEPELGGGALLDTGVCLLNLSSMIFGDDIIRINSHCTYTDRGLDAQETVTLRYRDGKMAELTSSMTGISDRRAVICGTEGYIVIDNVSNFEGLDVYDSSYNRVVTYKRQKQKTGYEYELEACARAIHKGDLECSQMPQSQTMSIMHMLDYIRKQLGIVFPQELAGGESPAGDEAPAEAPPVAEEAAAAAPLNETPDPAEETAAKADAPVNEAEDAAAEVSE